MQKSINFTKIYVKLNKLYINPDIYQISLSTKRVVKILYAWIYVKNPWGQVWG